MSEQIERLRKHVEFHKGNERAMFSIAGLEALFDLLKVLTADNITLTAQHDVLKEQNERLRHSNDLLRTQAYELVNQINELKTQVERLIAKEGKRIQGELDGNHTGR